jgi:hypothetical protein
MLVVPFFTGASNLSGYALEGKTHATIRYSTPLTSCLPVRL